LRGGYIAEKYGWRNAFFFAAIPGILFALLAFGLREPCGVSAESTGIAVKKTSTPGSAQFQQLLGFHLRATIFARPFYFSFLAPTLSGFRSSSSAASTYP